MTSSVRTRNLDHDTNHNNNGIMTIDIVDTASSSTTLSLRTLVFDSTIFHRSIGILLAVLGVYFLYYFLPEQGPWIDQTLLYMLSAASVVVCIYEDGYKRRQKMKQRGDRDEKDDTDSDDSTQKSETDDETDDEEEHFESESSVEDDSGSIGVGEKITIESGLADDDEEQQQSTPRRHPLVEKYLSKRLPYLDVIKVILIAIVVLTHTSQSSALPDVHPFSPDLATSFINPVAVIFAVLGIPLLPMSMSLFFFISGIFTPRSAKNKTVTEFLNNKLKRLVFPTMLVNFAIGPLTAFVWDVSIGNKSSKYELNYLSMWFLLYLAFFNVVYAFLAWAPMKSGDVALQEWFRKHLRFDATLFLWAMAIAGVANAISAYGLDVADGVKFIRKWSFSDALPSWMFYFFLGCFAGQEGWMNRFFERRSSNNNGDDDVEGGDNTNDETNDDDSRARSLIACCYYTWLPFAVIAIGSVSYLLYLQNVANAPWSIFEWICIGLIMSIVGLALIVVTLDWACRKIRSVNLTLLCMMQSAFAVYILHELVINLVMWLWIWILEKGFGIDLVFDEEGNNTTDLSNGIVVLGWIFVSILTQVIVWPFAFFVRKLPLLNRIL